MVPIPVARRVMTPATVRATFRLHVKIGVLRVIAAAACPDGHRSAMSPAHLSDLEGQSASSAARAPPYRCCAPRILRTCDVGYAIRSAEPSVRLRAARRLADVGERALLRSARRDRASHVAGPRVGSGDDAAVWSPEPGRDACVQPGCAGRGRRFPPFLDQPAPARGPRTVRRALRPGRDGRPAGVVFGNPLRAREHMPSRTSSRSSVGCAPPPPQPGARSPAVTSAPSTGRWSSTSRSAGTLAAGDGAAPRSAAVPATS